LGQFVNFNEQILIEEDDEFMTDKGFKNNFRIKKILEETFYNSNFEPFKVIKVDKCILDVYLIQINTQDYEQYLTENEDDFESLNEIPQNIQEFQDYLSSIEPVLFQNLLKYIDEFNKSYILLSGFKKQAIEKVDKYYKESIENFTLIDEKFNDKKNLEILKICIHG
jgi:cell division septum initiation protein DivIVA